MDSGDGSDSWSEWNGRETAADDETGRDGSERANGSGGEPGQGGPRDGASDSKRASDSGGSSGSNGPIARARWLATTDNEAVAFVREVASSLAIVAAIGLLLFAVSGIWPPMVAIESGSMEPNLYRGDLVFVMEEHRFAGGAAHAGTGVVSYRAGANASYREFNEYGDVIVYEQNGDPRATPIIHRARFWVNDGENWYDEANRAFLGGADDCEELSNCPAPHAGFITKGDHNGEYDQIGFDPISDPVKPSWITGTAEFRIPWLGEIRLLFGMVNAGASALVGTLSTPGGSVLGTLAGVGMVRAVR
ncbi:S26 family signal peptidase [Halococcus agarilyticus]|uniref:S26 family signal peptidase n=1 Tax=Halococcus agarilyticus TaxID=1232219 RepID=UPI0006779BEC|nr:S26 family signal peptidase [Halococcus agarilyticus]